MNPARFRSRVARRILVEGFDRPIPFQPLTRAQLLQIDASLTEQWEEVRSPIRDLSEQLEVLAASTGCDDIAALSISEVGDLFEAWERVQTEHMPDVDRLGAQAELDLVSGRGILLLDATAAAHSESPADFYGEPVGSLSDGQLAYYLTLKAAHSRWSEGGSKCRSLKVLKKLAGRSETTNQREGE